MLTVNDKLNFRIFDNAERALEELNHNILGEIWIINQNSHWYHVQDEELALKSLNELVTSSINMSTYAKRAIEFYKQQCKLLADIGRVTPEIEVSEALTALERQYNIESLGSREYFEEIDKYLSNIIQSRVNTESESEQEQ